MKAGDLIPEVSIRKGVDVLSERLIETLQDNLLRITLFGSRAEGRFVPEFDNEKSETPEVCNPTPVSSK